jgi:hypothetical protein
VCRGWGAHRDQELEIMLGRVGQQRAACGAFNENHDYTVRHECDLVVDGSPGRYCIIATGAESRAWHAVFGRKALKRLGIDLKTIKQSVGGSHSGICFSRRRLSRQSH